MKLLKQTILAFSIAASFAADAPKYSNDLQQAKVDTMPEEFLVLDGNFAVKEDGGNKFVELPGSPLDTFGFLFGPTAKENWIASARFFGTATGRRYPTFAIGLNGVGGYKLRVSPGKKQLELYKGDDVKTAVPLDWKAGKWTTLKLEIRKKSETEWQITGKIWAEGTQEPAEPAITFTETESLPSGRASISASPYSGTPVRFDDLNVAPLSN